MERKAAVSLARLRPRLEASFADDPAAWGPFRARLEARFEALFAPLLELYGGRWDFFWHLEAVLLGAARSWRERSPDLKAVDAAREADPRWFETEGQLGGVCYVDRFAGDLAGLRERLPYLEELGLTYLHLMPLFRSPAGEDDGGYAVSSYREVDPALGSTAELRELAAELRARGVALVLDFVLNHTSDEHDWARGARAGDPDLQDLYRLYPDRTLPDAFERHLIDIFPEVRPGSFTWDAELGRWVWTTFHSFQWDLDYANPDVFVRMADEMLSLANLGVDVLRLDAVAFLWKELGTSCQNLPQAHRVIQALNAVARIAAPGLLFKSEASVHPDEVARYVGPGECQLSYDPTLMALLWESLATREVRLLAHSLRTRRRLDAGCAWVDYVRSHDDIGWTFSDEDAVAVGIDPRGHRAFLNAFYTRSFPGSFARGLPFQHDPRTGDGRVSGTCAALCGLEEALREEAAAERDLAVARLLLLHGVILSSGGIPLLYLGDEVATLNDYGFRADPDRARDSRWVHRPATDWDRVARRRDPATVEGRVFAGLRRLIDVRRATPAFRGNDLEVVDAGNPHVLAYVRRGGGETALALASFSEAPQPVPPNALRIAGLGYAFRDLVTGEDVHVEGDLVLPPYGLRWLAPA